jgi:hypothetical protein
MSDLYLRIQIGLINKEASLQSHFPQVLHKGMVKKST